MQCEKNSLRANKWIFKFEILFIQYWVTIRILFDMFAVFAFIPFYFRNRKVVKAQLPKRQLMGHVRG